jgi:hypothetical protein
MNSKWDSKISQKGPTILQILKKSFQTSLASLKNRKDQKIFKIKNNRKKMFN